MQAFGFASPKTVDEAVALLTESAGNARVLGGGTDLIAQLDEGRIKTELVIDVKRIPQLTDLNYSLQTGLELGAATPCYRLYSNPEITSAYPGPVSYTHLTLPTNREV